MFNLIISPYQRISTRGRHGKIRLGGHRDGVPGRVMSLREIASQHGISEDAIRKRAKRDDWSCDLNTKVKEYADDLVRKADVRKQVRSEVTLNERVLIEATAEVITNVRMEHRSYIKRARQITNALFDELGAECDDATATQGHERGHSGKWQSITGAMLPGGINARFYEVA